MSDIEEYDSLIVSLRDQVMEHSALNQQASHLDQPPFDDFGEQFTVKQEIVHASADWETKTIQNSGPVKSSLFWSQPIKKKYDPELPERLIQKKLQSLQKRIEMKEQIEIEQLTHCTFQPDISVKRRRKISEFFQEQEFFQKRKAENLRKLREIQEEKLASLSFKPQMSKKSREYSNTFDRTELLETLYSSKSRKEKPVQKQTQSELVKKNVKPNSEIWNQLYEDSIRRMQPRNPQVKRNKGFSVSSRSQKVLVQAFVRQFNRTFSHIDIQSTGSLLYSLYIALLQNMKFISRNKSLSTYSELKRLAFVAWNSLRSQLEYQQDVVHKKPLLQFLLRVMNYIPSKTHQDFQIWFLHRKEQKQKRLGKQYILYSNFLSFKPNLSQKSLKIAQKSRENRTLSHFDSLIQDYQNFKQKLKFKRTQKLKNEISSHTFTPKINLNQHHSMINMRQTSMAFIWREILMNNIQTDRGLNLHRLAGSFDISEQAYDRLDSDLAECTFTPRIMKNIPKKSTVQVKGMAQAVQRLQIARRQKTRSSRPQTHINHIPISKIASVFYNKPTQFLSRNPTSAMRRHSRNLNPTTYEGQQELKDVKWYQDEVSKIPQANASIDDGSSGDEWPLTYSIKLLSGEVDQIVINETDNRADVIEEFIAKHELSGKMAQQVRYAVMFG